MKCFNCENEIDGIAMDHCPICSSIFNATKHSFLAYIGPSDSLTGYQKSYKLLLLKSIIEHIIRHSEALVSSVVAEIKDFYINRKKNGLLPDYDVDARILNIESASDYDVFAVIKSQPYKVINEKGYVFLNRNEEGKLAFIVNEEVMSSMSEEEWKKLLKIIDDKICLYYQRLDSAKHEKSKEPISTQTEDSMEQVALQSDESDDQVASNELQDEIEVVDLDPNLSVLEIEDLSVRARNVLMRNKLTTIGEILEFIKSHDLLELKNAGKKTCDEIFSILNSKHIKVSTRYNQFSIASLFAGNTFRRFVDYCNKNGILTLKDLEVFDFSELLKEPYFGLTSVEKIVKRYNFLLRDNPELVGKSVSTKQVSSIVESTIQIDPSNANLDIVCLRFVGIKHSVNFYQCGFSKIGQLSTITVAQLIRMFGNKGREYFERIKYFEKPFVEIATDYLNRQRNDRDFEFYIERANKKTLQEIADKHNLTKERVRQILLKSERRFAPLFNALIKHYMSEKNTFYISTQDVLEFFDDDDFDTVIMNTLQSLPNLEYLPFAELFVERKTPSQNTYAKLHRLSEELIGDEGIVFFDSLDRIEEMLNDSELDYISTEAYLNYLIEINAFFYGDYVFLKKQPYAKLCLLLIKKHFQDGINLYSDEDINSLRQYLFAEFGNVELPNKNRAISAQLSDHLITCDRGKAKLIEFISFDLSVIEEIKKYIDSSPLRTLYFSEIFNEFEGILAFTSDIVNYHGLHGILAYLYRDEYIFSRDCITKKDSSEASLSLSDRIDLLIQKKGAAISRTEIKSRIGGISDIMLANAIACSKTLLQWDYNSFNSINILSINENDKSILREMIEDVFSIYRGYCSDKLVFEKTKKEYSFFITCNHIENSTNLYYILQTVFSNEYQFSRPHICKKGIVSSLTSKNIALYLLGNGQIISRSAFISIAKSVSWSDATADLIFFELEKDYVRVSEDEFIFAERFVISEDDLNLIKNRIHSSLESKEYLSMIGLLNFDAFPEIGYPWNSFLLISIVKKYGLGLRIIKPAFKDRRYNKDILVKNESDFHRLDDIVYYLLNQYGIHTIDESDLLSFLIIHHLVSKIIPKEIFDSKQLNYADGYFKL